MTRSRALGTFNLILCSLLFLCVDSLRAQNIVEQVTSVFTANPVRLTDTDVSEFNSGSRNSALLPSVG